MKATISLILGALICGCSTPLPPAGTTILEDGTVVHVMMRQDLQTAARLAHRGEPLAPSEHAFCYTGVNWIYVEADSRGRAMLEPYYHELRHIREGAFHPGNGARYLGEWPKGSGWQWWE